MIIDGIKITTDFDASREELENYVEYVTCRVDGDIKSIHVKLCGHGYVDVNYTKANQKFERIRRITGYLVGTTDRWNDSKKAEEQDRVKHL